MDKFTIIANGAENRRGKNQAVARKIADYLEKHRKVCVILPAGEKKEEAYQSLTMVENSIAMEMPEDFFSIDLMNAYEALGRIVGESVGEDLVNEIFSKFCTGK